MTELSFCSYAELDFSIILILIVFSGDAFLALFKIGFNFGFNLWFLNISRLIYSFLGFDASAESWSKS